MQIGVMDDVYLFLEKEEKDYEYNHRYLVPGTEKGDYGMSEKSSGWTKMNAREFSRQNDVNIIRTSKRSV